MDSAIRKALQNKGEVDKWEQMNFINGGVREIANTGQYDFSLFK